MGELEVRSAAAARVERKEIGPAGNRLVENDFGKRDIGLHDAAVRNLDVGMVSRAVVQALFQPYTFVVSRWIDDDGIARDIKRMAWRNRPVAFGFPVEHAVNARMGRRLGVFGH